MLTLTLTTAVAVAISAVMFPIVALSAIVLTPFSDFAARVQMGATYLSYVAATMWIVGQVIGVVV